MLRPGRRAVPSSGASAFAGARSMKPPSALPIREGEIVASKYRVERVLGAGGMGVVVAAEHMQLRQRVAIKFLLTGGATGADAVARFMREAQAAARIQSEHVARVLDVAMLPDSTPYIVLEFLEGRDLAQILAARGPLPLEEAVGYILQACEGVAEAHAAGIIHRDLKPSNLYVCDRGAGRSRVKVLDFGISKSLTGTGGEGQLDLTATHATLGSPLYMSPEQMSSSKHVDVRTDVWSLGVTMFELVCATTPFGGESITELVTKVLSEPPRPVAQYRPDLPPAFSVALSRALEKDRTRRYASVTEFARAMAAFGPRQAAADVERIRDVPAAAALTSFTPGRAITQPGPGPLAADPNAASWASAATGVAPDSSVTPVSASTGDARRAARTVALGRRALLVVVAVFVAAAGVGGAIAMRRTGPPSVHSHDPAGAVPIAIPIPASGAGPGPSFRLAPTTPSAPAGAAVANLATEASLPTGRAGGVSASPAPHASGTARTRLVPVHPQPPGMASAATPALPPETAAAKSPAPAPPPVCHVEQYVDSQGDVRFKQVCP
jgi:serine/threonine protein kinase